MKFKKKLDLMKNSFNKHLLLLGFFNTIFFFIKKHLLKSEKLIVKLKHYDHPIHLRNGTSDLRVFGQIFISEEYSIGIKNLNPKIIIDCGANIGLSSIYFKHHFPTAKIYAFEPEISNFRMLKENLSYYDNVYLFQKAIWYENTKLHLLQHFSHDSFSITSKKSNGENTQVYGISINHILTEIINADEVDLIKIDIEGAELPLFTYKTEWVEKTKTILVEIHENVNPDSINFISQRLKDRFVRSESGEYFKFQKHLQKDIEC